MIAFTFRASVLVYLFSPSGLLRFLLLLTSLHVLAILFWLFANLFLHLFPILPLSYLLWNFHLNFSRSL